MISIDERIGLARVFGEKVQDTLTMLEFREAVTANARETDSGVCHTHDYCDANELMFTAWVEFFGQEPNLESDEEVTIWGEAWSIAKAAKFFY